MAGLLLPFSLYGSAPARAFRFFVGNGVPYRVWVTAIK